MRLPLLAAALALSFGLTGCGGDPEATGPGPDVPQAATTTALTFIHVTTGAMNARWNRAYEAASLSSSLSGAIWKVKTSRVSYPGSTRRIFSKLR